MARACNGSSGRALATVLVLAAVMLRAGALVPDYSFLPVTVLTLHRLIWLSLLAILAVIARRSARRARLLDTAAAVAHQETSDALLRLLTIMDTLADGVFVCNQQGQLTLVNPAATRLLGLPGDGSPPRSIEELARLVQMRRADSAPMPASETALARALRGESVDDREVIIYNGLLGGDRFLRVSATPLYNADGAAIGAVAVASDMTEAKETLLALKAQARTLLQLNRRLERLATRDNLTDVLNHRGFEEQLEEAVARARRFGHHVSLMLVDVDHFKNINDTYGHPAGDAVLAAIADRLHGGVRTFDAVGRLGGDEFAVLMPETDHTGAFTLARRLQQAMRMPVRAASGVDIPVTVSVGVVTRRGDDIASVEDVLHAADEALYEVKRTGRDDVHSFEQPCAAVAS